MKTILKATFALIALSSAAFALPPGKGAAELTTKDSFAKLKAGDKVILVCKMDGFRKEITIKDTKAATALCEQDTKAHCDTCKKDYKVTWTSPKSGPTTTMTIVDEHGKPCMVYVKES